MGRFDKYHGILEVEIDGEKFELKPTMKDKRMIMRLGKQSAKDESKWDELLDVYKQILKNSYPEEKEENLDAFMLKNETKLMEALSVAFGWSNPGELEAARKKAVVETESP